MTPCLFNSQVSLPFFLLKFVEVHHAFLRHNRLHDIIVGESTRLISWPVSRLFSRVVKYAERDNPLTATKKGTYANIWNRIKNDTFLPFIVDIHVLKIRESEMGSGSKKKRWRSSSSLNGLLISLITYPSSIREDRTPI